MTNRTDAKPKAKRKDDDADKPMGVRCPSCECTHVPVYYTRERMNRVVRVRQCRDCGRRFQTTEQLGG